jgi:D-alanyl-D-alanine carboxypeptidase/D-alanyl-D-alanine-endopeptidase (penicillin-binding protein 4)
MQVEVSPITSYVRFVNQAKTGAAGTRQTIEWASDSTLPDQSHIVTIRGSMPAGGQKILYAYGVPSPSRFAEVAFTEALRQAGVNVEARSPAPAMSSLASAYTDANVIAEHVSASMSEEVKVTLKVSQNLHASMTPRLLGAIVGKKDTSRTGFDLEREFLQHAGLDLSGAQQADGAGGDAHFTPAFMVSYLEYMTTRADYQKFLAALPILGRDGTLFDIQSASPAAGHVFAKTGTFGTGDPLNRAALVTAKGLAGYMTTVDGRHLAFAIYVNNVTVPREPDAVKRIVGQALGELAAAAYDAR